MTMTLVSTITVGSGGASSIEFTGIANDLGQDLQVVLSARGSGGLQAAVTFNSDTGSNYGYVRLRGSGSSVLSQSGTTTSIDAGGVVPTSYTADTFSSCSYYISNYAVAAPKSISIETTTETNATTSYMFMQAASYSPTTAISSIKLANSSFVEHTTASLYAIS